VYIAVEDSGIGISNEAQQNLFNPFSQADSSIARKFGGTGLGLAICKRLIEAMGSEIKLSSVEGQGTTFSFTLLLPPGDQQAAIAEGRTNEILSGGNLAKPMNILVVDDNAVNRKVMEGLLARDGHRVSSVASGAEALTILRTKTFDLVFMDIEMPQMNGTETMQKILETGDARLRAIPVVALTGNVSEEDKLRYKSAGMRDTLAKPIDPERLRNILLAHGQAAGEAPARRLQESAPAKKIVTMELSDAELEEDSFSQSVEYTGVDTHKGDDVTGGYVPQPPQPAPSLPAAATDTDENLLDARTLGSLRASLGEAQLQEMMAGVFAHNRSVLPTLQTAFADKDTEILRGCAHELKGMNGNFGLKAISDIAAEIEAACRNGKLADERVRELVSTALPEAMMKTEKIFGV
jgi:CheY-like chemotaxis protein